MGKSWTEGQWKFLLECLAKENKVANAYRMFSEKYPGIDEANIRKMFRRKGLGSPKDYLGGEVDFDPARYIEGEIEKRKSELIEQAEKRELTKYRKQQAITELLTDQLKAEIYRLPKPKVIAPKRDKILKRNRDSIDIMAIVSDCQIGQKVNLKDVGGLNEYNFDVFLKELEIWKNEVIRFIEVQLLTQDVDNIVFPMIGDIVEGHDIFSGQAYHLDMDVLQQVTKGSRAFSEAFAEISLSFPDIPVKIIGLPGNHGRVGKKGETPNNVNWDVITYTYIEHELRDFTKDYGGNIEFQWSDAWFQLYKSKGWLFCFIHGEDIRGWMGLPYYGVDKAKAKYMEMFNQYITYFCLGHHHKEAILPSDNGEKIINGNWVGGTDGSKMWMGSNNPNQWIFTINEKYGILLREKIYLKTRHESKPKIKIYE